MKNTVVFVSNKICLDDEIKPAGILVSCEGKIQKIVSKNEINTHKSFKNVQVIDVGDLVIMPGIIDSHVHINEPGRTDWEGYLSATKAAAAGGITTVIDMPLNSIPPTTTLENFKEKLKATENQLFVDVGFWGGFIPGNENDLEDLISAGVVGFKCFMCPSGVDEFPNINKVELEKAFKKLNGTYVVLAFHAEVDEPVSVHGNPHTYNTFLKSRPAKSEVEAIKIIINLSKKYNVKCHIVHLSAADAIPIITEAKANGCNLTVETCHHYLSLQAEDIPDKATQYKCCPPIRGSENQKKLWKALSDGVINLVVSDHSPCTPNLKFLDQISENTGDFLKAWGGIASVQLGLPLFWTEAKKRGFSILDIHKYMTVGPAKLAGLENRKGLMREGYDADFVIWDPEATFTVEESMIYHKNKITPYLGKRLYGKVLKTVLRGNIIYENEKHTIPQGICLFREI